MGSGLGFRGSAFRVEGVGIGASYKLLSIRVYEGLVMILKDLTWSGPGGEGLAGWASRLTA